MAIGSLTLIFGREQNSDQMSIESLEAITHIEADGDQPACTLLSYQKEGVIVDMPDGKREILNQYRGSVTVSEGFGAVRNIFIKSDGHLVVNVIEGKQGINLRAVI